MNAVILTNRTKYVIDSEHPRHLGQNYAVHPEYGAIISTTQEATALRSQGANGEY